MQQQFTQQDLIEKSTPITTQEGNQVWQQGFLLRKVSKFIIGTNEDAIIPIPFWYNPESGELYNEGIPNELKKELFTDEVKNEILGKTNNED
jgi:hypothetical protein